MRLNTILILPVYVLAIMMHSAYKVKGKIYFLKCVWTHKVLNMNQLPVLFRISLDLELCGGKGKTVAPLHVAGHCSQHASFSRTPLSPSSDKRLPRVILKSNNQEKQRLPWNADSVSHRTAMNWIARSLFLKRLRKAAWINDRINDSKLGRKVTYRQKITINKYHFVLFSPILKVFLNLWFDTMIKPSNV